MQSSSLTFSEVVIYFGLALQVAIFVLLIAKRLSLKFPAFTLTILFFIVRFALTFCARYYSVWMLSKLSRATWTTIFQGISITEDVLQAAIIVELALLLVPALAAWKTRIWWKISVGAVVAAIFAGTALYTLGYTLTPVMKARGITTKALIQPDIHIALVALTAELVILAAFAVVSMHNSASGSPVQWLATKFALGWGIFGSVNLSALAVSHYAISKMDRGLMLSMQNIVSGAYALMMLLWVLAVLFYKKPAAVTTNTETAAA